MNQLKQPILINSDKMGRRALSIKKTDSLNPNDNQYKFNEDQIQPKPKRNTL